MNKKEIEIPNKNELWNTILKIGRKNEKGIVNKFNKDDVITIIATMEFFNSTDIWIRQTVYDLTVCKYKLYDWLAMCVMSRNNDNRQLNNVALKVLVYAYLSSEGDSEGFIDNLRYNDYQINTNWEKIQIPD
jgi:hypothetical protein